jgi:hypothetical protein
VKNDNTALGRYINARRKKEEDWRKEDARKKAEEEAHKKTEDGQNSKNVRTRVVQRPLPPPASIE